MSQKPPARPSLICYHVGGSRDSGSLLAKFIRHTLGRDVAPESGPIDEMLSTCPLCSRQYLHLVDLMTATQIDALDASGLDASLTPGCTEGLLAIYQLYIGAAQRLGDPHALVLGLGIMGRVRLRMNEIEEAQRVAAQ